MPSAANLLLSAADLGLVLLAGPPDAQPMTSLLAIETLTDVGRCVPGSLVVVMEHAARSARPHELDVALRRAADSGAAALILIGGRALPDTTQSLAQRAGVAVLAAPSGADIAELLLRADRVQRGGAAQTLTRALAGMAALQLAEAAGAGIDAILTAVSAALHQVVGFTTDDPEASDRPGGPPVVLRGQRVGLIEVERPDEATYLLLPAVSDAVARFIDRDLSQRFAPAQDRAELLSQIVVAEPVHLAVLTEQARLLGFAIDRSHLACWISFRQVASERADPSLLRLTLDRAQLICLQGLQSVTSQWHVARTAGSLLLVQTDRAENLANPELSHRTLQQVLSLLTPPPGITTYAGMGTAQPGAEGLRQSTNEAQRAADTAEHRQQDGTVTMFDADGLQRLLVELYATPQGRRSIAKLLAPFDSRGAAKSLEYVQTVAAYLDSGSSPTKTGRVLRLHPNAVTYRIRRIEELLGTDLSDDDDERFALHLACKARLVGQATA